MNDSASMNEYKNTAQALMEIKGNADSFPFIPVRDRFDLGFCENTSLRKDLNANRLKVNGNNIAIATQYPFPHQLEAQLQMMVENRTPALVILASNSDIENHKLPNYFSKPARYKQIQTQSTLTGHIDLGDGIQAKLYQMTIAGYESTIEIPIIHVHNWPDHQTVSVEATINLVSLIESTINEKRNFYIKRRSRAALDPNKMLPVIHCRAGVGRTGQTIAAMAMKRYPQLSLATITKNLRETRNDFMIEKLVQMETLLALEKYST